MYRITIRETKSIFKTRKGIKTWIGWRLLYENIFNAEDVILGAKTVTATVKGETILVVLKKTYHVKVESAV